MRPVVFALAVLLAVPASAIDAQQDTSRPLVGGNVQDLSLCDVHTKSCTAAAPGDVGLPPLFGMPLSGDPFKPFDPFFPDGISDALHEAWPAVSHVWSTAHALLTVPNATANATVDASANASAGPFSAGFDIHAEVGASTEPDSPPPAQPGQVPCSDPRGCPDLIVDPSRLLLGVVTEETFPSGHCSVVEGSVEEPGTRRLLRFTSTTPNVGDGALIVGRPGDHPEWFVWGDCHGHWHYREYADYRLWTVEGYAAWQDARAEDPGAPPGEVLESNPGLRDHLVTGRKQGFCVIDVRPYAPLDPPTYWTCDDQGISRGWADEYHFLLDGQWVDITGVEPGLYVLEAEVNADRLFVEADYTNNAGAALVVIPARA